MNGRGVERDEREAARWYRRAADLYHPDAQIQLGICYRDGLGVTRDPVEAYVLWDLAARRGSGEAAALKEALAKDMDAAQIAEANERSREIMPERNR